VGRAGYSRGSVGIVFDVGGESIIPVLAAVTAIEKTAVIGTMSFIIGVDGRWTMEIMPT
jgi:hypothetical protein